VRRAAVLACAVAAAALATAAAARAQDDLGKVLGPQRPRETLQHFEARITAELRARSPAAADVFARAAAAADSGDLAAAEAGYRRVLEMVPGWNHAQRRLCGIRVHLEHRTEGLALCRQAYATAHTPENTAALIYALTARVPGDEPKPEEVQEALGLARELVKEPAAGVNEYQSVCLAAMAGDDRALLTGCVAGLDEVAPAALQTNYFGIVLAASESDWDRAEERLHRAEAAGLPASEAARLQEIIARERPWWPRLARAGLVVGGAWAAALVLMLAAGLLLSALALRAAGRVAAAPAAEPVRLAAALRRSYRVVLWFGCVLYYLSLPLVLVAVVGAGALVVVGVWSAGVVPVKLIVIAVVVVFVTLGAMVRSLLVRPDRTDPGVKLDATAHPKLAAVLQEVAKQIGTRPVDNVYLTPGTDLAVTERGGVLRQMRSATERCLILGVGALDGFKVGPFKAVLAHEYGHFSNRDTAGGGFALAVRRSILTMAVAIARGGAAAWYNPAWLFINAFYRLFLLVSQGASRLQEVLADRWAALAYGAAEFERGLRHLIARSVEFEGRANAVLQEVVSEKAPLANLYSYRPAHLPAPAEVEQAVAAAMEAKPSRYDSHPAPAQRLAWVHAITARPTGDLSGGDADAWELFSDRVPIEVLMTREVRANLERSRGIAIAGV